MDTSQNARKVVSSFSKTAPRRVIDHAEGEPTSGIGQQQAMPEAAMKTQVQ